MFTAEGKLLSHCSLHSKLFITNYNTIELTSQETFPIVVNLNARLPNISRLSRWAIRQVTVVEFYSGVETNCVQSSTDICFCSHLSVFKLASVLIGVGGWLGYTIDCQITYQSRFLSNFGS